MITFESALSTLVTHKGIQKYPLDVTVALLLPSSRELVGGEITLQMDK